MSHAISPQSADALKPRIPLSVDPSASAIGYILGGCATILVLFVGFGGWAATTVLSSAVIAQGTVVVETSVKTVQHPTGGVVGEILVKEGDKVRAGDLLLRLDQTVTQTNLQIVTNQLNELAIRESRIKAERDDDKEITLPASLYSQRLDPQISALYATEQVIFLSRRKTCDSQQSQFEERIAQYRQEIGGVTSQASAKSSELSLLEKELDGLAPLEAKRLVTTNKMMTLRRESARLKGELGQLLATAAQLKGKVAETELQLLSHMQERRGEVVKELREVQSKQGELIERKIAAEDQLKKIEMRSPQTGVVHQLTAHTVGGVIEAGKQIMLIVPQGDQLVVEARIATRDIDQVRLLNRVNVRFPAFSLPTTPEFNGIVTRVSADLTKDEQTGQPYYAVKVSLDDGETDKLDRSKLALLPGMPAEVQIKTSDRTALSYLVKPVSDQMARAFKER